jgi:hypothetical protein
MSNQPSIDIVTSLLGFKGARPHNRGNIQFLQQIRCSRSVLRLPVDGGSPFAGYLGGRPRVSSRTACRCYRAELILLFTNLLTIAFTCECFLHALLFTRFQVKRVTLDFLDNIFGLHLALKAPQGILKGFAFLYSNLCQEKYTSKRSQSGFF